MLDSAESCRCTLSGQIHLAKFERLSSTNTVRGAGTASAMDQPSYGDIMGRTVCQAPRLGFEFIRLALLHCTNALCDRYSQSIRPATNNAMEASTWTMSYSDRLWATLWATLWVTL